MATSTYDCPDLPVPLAGRVVLQVDQTAPPDQGVFRYKRERREDQIWIALSIYVLVAIVRKRLGLEASSLPNSTRAQHHALRENAHFTGTSGLRLRQRLTRPRQPVESMGLLTGGANREIRSSARWDHKGGRVLRTVFARDFHLACTCAFKEKPDRQRTRKEIWRQRSHNLQPLERRGPESTTAYAEEFGSGSRREI